MGPIWFPVRRMRQRSLGYPQPPPRGPLRARPDFLAPADLAAGDGPAVRDAFKRATAARSAWLAVSAAFCAAILDSIGESNCLAISDPDTDHEVSCTMLWTVNNGAIGQQTFEAYAAYILGQHRLPTSLPIPTFDPSLATSKGTKTERARMMASEGT